MRNCPKFLPKYYGGSYTKLSKCGVNVRFIFNEEKNQYERIEGSWKKVHDHRLELDERCMLSNDVMDNIKHWWMDDPNIRCSEIIKRVRDSTHTINDMGQSVYLHLKHLDILNALKIIRGCGHLNMDDLMTDLQNVQSKYPDAQVQVNTGTPTIIYIQTKDMLDLYRLYTSVVLVSISRRRKNKYDFYCIKLTGINNMGNTLIFAIAFTNIKCKETYDWIFKTFLNRAQNEFVGKTKLMVVPLEKDMFESVKKNFPEDNQHCIVNQYHFLSVCKDMLNQYKKRMDFDYILCQNKLDEIVQEIQPRRF